MDHSNTRLASQLDRNPGSFPSVILVGGFCVLCWGVFCFVVFGGVSRFFSGLWVSCGFCPVDSSVGVLFQMEVLFKGFSRIHGQPSDLLQP